MASTILEIFELVKYVNGGSRPFEEGCRVLNSNHILLCGLCSTKNRIDKYFALCLQSSSLTSYPHEVNVEISNINNEKNINAHCTCQAGNSGTCKHIVGVLLLLNRKTKDNIEQLGFTDLRQQWGHIKQKVSDTYAAEPFHKFCHGTQVQGNYEKTPEIRKQLFKILIEADPESKLGQHVQCCRSSLPSQANATFALPKKILKSINSSNTMQSPVICNLNSTYGFLNNVVPEEILRLLNNCIWSKYLENFKVILTSQEQAIYYKNNVCLTIEKAKEIFINTIKQNSSTWYEQRNQRITGSICYNIFTFMKSGHDEKEQWNKKLQSIYKSTFKGNIHTFRGQEGESKAKIAYEKVTGARVQEMGLFVLKITPWLGFSADGFANKCLVEIKCPKNPNNLTAANLLKTLTYNTFESNVPKLKARHQYYGQVQLGMALLQLEKCHFVIYEPNHDSCAIVQVPRDDIFLKDLIKTLSECYFSHILPWLMDNVTKDKENSNK